MYIKDQNSSLIIFTSDNLIFFNTNKTRMSRGFLKPYHQPFPNGQSLIFLSASNPRLLHEYEKIANIYWYKQKL